MKLSNVFAKLTGGKAKVMSTLGGLAIAGAAMTMAAPAAKAQVAFGVTVGGPRYYAPAPRPVYRTYGYGYVAPAYPAYGYAVPAYGWDHRRYEDWRAHEYWEHRDHRYDRGWRR
ncbi:MAG TPA: hypothetical protein VKV02_02520 [Acidobacteriaceae bacterium]|nr:hypothetical protein [Acidobacteriaceae bacterium]